MDDKEIQDMLRKMREHTPGEPRYVRCPTCKRWAEVNDWPVGDWVRKGMMEATKTFHVYARCHYCHVSFTSAERPLSASERDA